MADKSITERQQYWLNHLKAADAADISLVQYAEANELKVKDLYQWKTSLTKRGFWASSASKFIAVKAKPSSAVCSMVLPNGIRLEFQGALSPDLIKTMVSSASQLS
jgi:hypothetical protein